MRTGWSEPLLIAHTTLLEVSCRGYADSADNEFKVTVWSQIGSNQIWVHTFCKYGRQIIAIDVNAGEFSRNMVVIG